MKWKKRGFLRQSTEYGSKDCGDRREEWQGRDAGQITLCSGLFFTLFLAVLLSAQLQMEMFRSSAGYLEDALAASGLACALIDIREYGYSHVVKISDEEAAYERYLKALKENLGLNESWEGNNRRLISGRVTLETYIIYNVSGEKVEICRMDGEGKSRSEGRLGEVHAPNGQIIQKTGVYSEISYPVQGLFGVTVNAKKGKLVDIVGAD